MGIKDLVSWNTAAMMKHLWDIARKKDILWVKWCRVYAEARLFMGGAKILLGVLGLGRKL